MGLGGYKIHVNSPTTFLHEKEIIVSMNSCNGGYVVARKSNQYTECWEIFIKPANTRYWES